MEKKPGLLLLDDEKEILNALKRLLRKDYDVHTFSEGEDALAAMPELDICLIVSDMRMPNMDGATFLTKAKELNDKPVRILLTGYADMESTARAINDGGIYSYINKPWNNEELKQSLSKAHKHYQLEQKVFKLQQDLMEKNEELQVLNKSLEQKVAQRTKQLVANNGKLKQSIVRQRALFQSVLDLINAVAQQRTGSDNVKLKRVASHARLVADRMSDERQFSQKVYLAAMLHELGKISLPDELLAMKEHEMDGDQRVQYHGHVIEGAGILSNISHLKTISEIVAHMYEDVNGHGFPRKLVGDNIPLGSRILRVVNDYDELLSGNLMPTPLPPENACEHLKKFCGVHYDRAVVNVYQDVLQVLPSEGVHDFDYCISSKDLEVDMTLAKDINYPNGTTMLTEGTHLTPVQIEKIRLYETEHQCNLVIFVH